ncbi:FtsX-like permease family protein [Paenibacillus oenotherae]|uniref:FtsX-like permease family protein n=1 Tax=Paenibacillus oenotherae TaxID=1435645 RepID=A0ABS7D7E1_9BACL|nr:FtsX-like permease family protein [Paenibacillus oenotherae]MBW7475859.1 FtsX-like permease family protein [Paenibacillus oenotherae]
MGAFRLAWKLLHNNRGIYGLYLIVLAITVATCYNFMAIQYNTAFVQLAEQLQSAVVASMTCGFVLLCTVVFFLWHANGFFFKQRQREIGLYMLMGISTSRIGRVLAIESMLLGGLSLLIGLPVGLLLSRLFFLLLGKAMFLEEGLPFTLSWQAIVQLVVVFGALFTVLGLKNYRAVKRSRLIGMLQAAARKQAPPRLKAGSGILGVVLIAAGYVIAMNFKQWNWDLLLASMSILILVSLGTYMFFGSCLAVILSKLMASKTFVYRSVRLVSISNVFFRLRGNYRSLAMTAILAAATVTAFSISLSFRGFAEDHVIIEAPYSLSFISDDAQIRGKAAEVLGDSRYGVIGVHENRFVPAQVEYADSGKRIDFNNEAIVTSYSEIRGTLEFLQAEEREHLLERMTLRGGEAVFILNANTMASPINVEGEEIRLNGNTYAIKESIQVPFIGNIAAWGKKNIYVLEDQEYEKLRSNGTELTLSGIQLAERNGYDGQDEQEGIKGQSEHSEYKGMNRHVEPKELDELVQRMAEIVPGGRDHLNDYAKPYIQEYYALGIFFFLGLIMSMVFALATFSTIYFKILSDALMDREQYAILKQIGMSRREVRRSVYWQVGIAFVLPVIVGILHSIFAMNMLEEIMNVEFAMQMIYGVGLFAVIMGVFYAGISRNYTKMVYEN